VPHRFLPFFKNPNIFVCGQRPKTKQLVEFFFVVLDLLFKKRGGEPCSS
jgi:hypothetical protein